MKVKLLKKLHKRYDWYFNDEKYPVLIDHWRKTAVVYSLEYCLTLSKYSLEAERKVHCGYLEWAMRMMKRDILTSWGWSVDKSLYKMANRKFKTKQRK